MVGPYVASRLNGDNENINSNSNGRTQARDGSAGATADSAAGGSGSGRGGASHAGDPQCVATLLRAIHDERIDPRSLSTERRRECVAHLTAQGFGALDIARLLCVSERTIERDRRTLRADNAIAPSVHLGDELMGEMHAIVLASVQRLTRLATDTDAPHYARVWAETAIVKHYLQLVDKTRQLDYIPSGTDRLRDAIGSDLATLERELQRARRNKERLADPFGEVKRLERDYEAAKAAAASDA